MQMQSVSISKIIEIVESQKPYLIGIAGVPGAGKSTISQILHKNIPLSKIVPMDGYHLYRNQLNQEGMKRRGAQFTFDKQKFRKDIQQLKKNKQGKFASFDHKNKDPVQNSIEIHQDTKYVIVEGLYLFYDEWGLNDLWDLKIWIDCEPTIAIQRVVKRNFQAGIQPTLQLSIQRVNNNDKLNLEQIILKSNIQNAYKISNSNQYPQ